MRTTLAIDHDVLAAAKHLSEREQRTVGEVVSHLARQGLARSDSGARAERNGIPLLAGKKWRRACHAGIGQSVARRTGVICHLLDVNVLIALIDPAHIQHDEVHAWFGEVGCMAFATCPITESGLLRIVRHPKYPNSPGPPSAVAGTLATIRGLSDHRFWPDTVSLMDPAFVDAARLSSHTRVTDSYLLALASAHKGRLATLDLKLATDAVAAGTAALALISR